MYPPYETVQLSVYASQRCNSLASRRIGNCHSIEPVQNDLVSQSTWSFFVWQTLCYTLWMAIFFFFSIAQHYFVCLTRVIICMVPVWHWFVDILAMRKIYRCSCTLTKATNVTKNGPHQDNIFDNPAAVCLMHWGLQKSDSVPGGTVHVFFMIKKLLSIWWYIRCLVSSISVLLHVLCCWLCRGDWCRLLDTYLHWSNNFQPPAVKAYILVNEIGHRFTLNEDLRENVL